MVPDIEREWIAEESRRPPSQNRWLLWLLLLATAAAFWGWLG